MRGTAHALLGNMPQAAKDFYSAYGPAFQKPVKRPDLSFFVTKERLDLPPRVLAFILESVRGFRDLKEEDINLIRSKYPF